MHPNTKEPAPAWDGGSAFDALPEAALVVDDTGNILRINRSAAELLDLPPQAALGQNCHRLLHCAETAPSDCPVCRLIAGRTRATDLEIEWKTRGTWHSISVAPVSSHGSPAGMVYTFRDITRHKMMEKALRDSEARYRALVENASDWAWETDEMGRFIYVSPSVAETLGFQGHEMLGKSRLEFMPPENAVAASEKMSSWREKLLPFRGLETTKIHRNGAAVIFESDGFPYFDSSDTLERSF